MDKTKTNPSDVDTSKPVKTEVTNSRPAEVDSPNSRPAAVNVSKAKPEIDNKVKPDIHEATAAASAIPKVKAQEPDLPKAGQPEAKPDVGKKVQKPEEVDTEANKAGKVEEEPQSRLEYLRNKYGRLSMNEIHLLWKIYIRY
ncbi:hypothetical protein [Streptococcus oricebi]|uniref:hypothetical protein n=1 Tax=Streptococcus oricebi TaxID=1547447 RepID=UPI001FDA57DD|nr:hypothetical protein [Streptococcus oricebi]